MGQYVGAKLVSAEPEGEGFSVELPLVDHQEPNVPGREGYVTWIPEDLFHANYVQVESEESANYMFESLLAVYFKFMQAQPLIKEGEPGQPVYEKETLRIYNSLRELHNQHRSINNRGITR